MTIKTLLSITTLSLALFVCFQNPAIAQDEEYDNLTLGISGLVGEPTPQLTFFTRSLEGAHQMTFEQNPKGLLLNANSPFPTLWVRDKATVAALTLAEESIGFGTTEPTQPFHFYSSDRTDIGFSEARIVVENDKSETDLRTMFQLVNNGGSRFAFHNTDSSEEWAFLTNPSDDFVISRAGTGGGEVMVTKNGAFKVGPGAMPNLYLTEEGNMFIMGTLYQQSDRESKKNFQNVDSQSILEKVSKLPIKHWQYKDDEDSIRHIGPMAQDFRATFGLGKDEKTIASVDTAGVAFAAIQALNSKLDAKDKTIVDLEDRTRQLEDQIAELRDMIPTAQ